MIITVMILSLCVIMIMLLSIPIILLIFECPLYSHWVNKKLLYDGNHSMWYLNNNLKVCTNSLIIIIIYLRPIPKNSQREKLRESEIENTVYFRWHHTFSLYNHKIAVYDINVIINTLWISSIQSKLNEKDNLFGWKMLCITKYFVVTITNTIRFLTRNNELYQVYYTRNIFIWSLNETDIENIFNQWRWLCDM